MIRIIGAILIISGTAAWGVGNVMRLRSRARSLSSLTSALDIMKSEICDRLTPMPELLELLGQEASAPADILFKNAAKKMSELGGKSFAEIWRQALHDTPELLLTPQEDLAMSELGLSLGRYNVEEQKAALTYAQRRMENYAVKAEQERNTNSRLQAFMGVAAGIFAVVVLI